MEVEAIIRKNFKVARQNELFHADTGFYFRNWIYNAKEIVTTMNAHESYIDNRSEINLDLTTELSTENMLGMFWR